MGSITEITTDDLEAQDKDSPAEKLEFIITPPSNGHLALKSAPSRSILNFTQAHINQGQLVLVHSGEKRFHSRSSSFLQLHSPVAAVFPLVRL